MIRDKHIPIMANEIFFIDDKKLSILDCTFEIGHKKF